MLTLKLVWHDQVAFRHGKTNVRMARLAKEGLHGNLALCAQFVRTNRRACAQASLNRDTSAV
jgi:hypothetical protein